MAGCERPCRAQPADRSLSQRTGAPQASASRRDRSPPVHGGYTRSRQVGECNGHQRSRRVLRKRRSAHQVSRDQGTFQAAGQSSSLPPLPTGLLLAAVREEGRLADPSDLLDGAAHGVLLDDDGAPDPEKVKAANSELLARRPHYAKRIGGDVGQGARPGQPNKELWASSSPGRARYGATGTGGSLRVG
jgi:hypothetical protein